MSATGELSSPHDAPPTGRRVRFVVALLACALAEVTFLGLGTWQWQRLGWKRDLIARVEQRLATPPAEAPGASAWPGLRRDADEYRRVRLRGHFAPERQALVRASTALGTGYWWMVPLQRDDASWVWINRGFVPEGWHAPQTESAAADSQDVLGLLRLTEPHGSLLQANRPAEGRWYSRDVLALSAAHLPGVGPVAPYFVDAAAGPDDAPDAWPRPGLTVVVFSNNHLEYALTWYALALGLAGAVTFVLRRPPRPRDARHDHALPADRPRR